MSRSSWAKLLDAHMSRRGMYEVDLAKLLGLSQPTINDYKNGELRPPLARMTDLADVLELIGQDRLTFIEEAYLAHAPDRVRIMFDDLRRYTRRLEDIVRKHGLDPGSVR